MTTEQIENLKDEIKELREDVALLTERVQFLETVEAWRDCNDD